MSAQRAVHAGPPGYLEDALAARGSSLSAALRTLGPLPRMCAARGLISFLPLDVLALPGPAATERESRPTAGAHQQPAEAGSMQSMSDQPGMQPECPCDSKLATQTSREPSSRSEQTADGNDQQDGPLSAGQAREPRQQGAWSLLTDSALLMACQGLEDGSDAVHKYHALMLLSVSLQQASKALQV